MEIKVTVTGLDNLAESIALLASAIGAHAGAQMKGVVAPTVKTEEDPSVEKPKAPSKPKAQPKPAQEPEVTEVDEPTPFDTDAEEGKAYTLEAVRAALAGLKDKHGVAPKPIIQEFGKADKLTDVDPANYGAMMAEVARIEAAQGE